MLYVLHIYMYTTNKGALFRAAAESVPKHRYHIYIYIYICLGPPYLGPP